MAFSFAKREKEVIDNLIELSHKTVEVTTILKHLFELFLRMTITFQRYLIK